MTIGQSRAIDNPKAHEENLRANIKKAKNSLLDDTAALTMGIVAGIFISGIVLACAYGILRGAIQVYPKSHLGGRILGRVAVSTGVCGLILLFVVPAGIYNGLDIPVHIKSIRHNRELLKTHRQTLANQQRNGIELKNPIETT